MDEAPSTPTSLGEFRVVGVLGQGGSGVVYEAFWGSRRVALKVLHEALGGTDRLRAQFLAEARRLQMIAHAAVVKVLAVGELPDGRPYLAMEQLEGETLAELLVRGPLAVPQALALFEELCGAVGALHDQGLVHRDLKPENIMIVGGEHAVLLDFGIAKELAAAASTTTIDGGVRGTPAYMAPERFFGQPAGIATDVYELAVTLYAMLAGQLPWEDLADPEARLQPRPLVEVVAVSSELDVEIRRAMSTRAQNRPVSAAVFLDAVRLASGAASTTKASETARMGPARDPATERRSWFAERKATTERGKTPLAWAPAEAERPPRRRWPYAAAIGAVAAIAGGLVAWRAGRGDDPSAPSPAAAVVASDDPWASTYAPPAQPSAAISAPISELPRDGAPVTIADARREVAAAIAHVPADTHLLFSAVIGELRDNDQIRQILAKVARQPQVAEVLAELPCLGPIVTGSEWVVFAASSLGGGNHGVLILRGRWQRADVERCFTGQSKRLALQDGETMLELPRLGWVDFVDDHTVYVSVRDDLAAAQVHDLARGGHGPTPHTRELLARLPADRTITAVVDGSGKLAWPDNRLPIGSDATAWVRVTDGGTALDVQVNAGTDIRAQALVLEVKPVLDDLFDGMDPALVGKLDVVRDKTVFVIRGRLAPLMIGMIAAGLP